MEEENFPFGVGRKLARLGIIHLPPAATLSGNFVVFKPSDHAGLVERGVAQEKELWQKHFALLWREQHTPSMDYLWEPF